MRSDASWVEASALRVYVLLERSESELDVSDPLAPVDGDDDGRSDTMSTLG